MLIQIKIIFSFMDQIINLRKGQLWDCLSPGQYSRTFYRIWKVNLQKSSNQRRALTRYAAGCLRRQCTPDLLISSYPNFLNMADPCGNPSWSSQSSMCHHNLCDPFHGIPGVQETQVLVMMTHNAQMVHRLLSGVLKLGLHGNHGSSKGDVAQPQPMH